MSANKHFLKAAEQALRRLQRPAYVRDILQYAVSEGLLVTDGSTPVNTLRARLSEDMIRRGEDSIFVRVGPNKFALREQLSDEDQEYHAPRFVKSVAGESVVCVPQGLVDRLGRFFGFSRNVKEFIRAVADETDITVLSRAAAETRDDLKQLVSYVLLQSSSGDILSYERGVYSNAADFLKGVLCIGFGGHVSGEDLIDLNSGSLDLFRSQTAGTLAAAHREIAEELRTSSFQLDMFEPVGVINDDSSPVGLRRLAFVFRATLPENFDWKGPRERSVNKPALLTPNQVWERYHELEFWSQLLCQHLCGPPPAVEAVIVEPDRLQWNPCRPLIVVGEIGSGKTVVAETLAECTGATQVSTRSCVADLIGAADFGTGPRESFQDQARQLVSTPDGVARLAESIVAKVASEQGPVVVDGVRNVDTIRQLRSRLDDPVLVYVEAPRDLAFDLYRLRAARTADLAEFRRARHHAVEREVPLLKHDADAYIFNGGSLRSLRDRVGEWANGFRYS